MRIRARRTFVDQTARAMDEKVVPLAWPRSQLTARSSSRATSASTFSEDGHVQHPASNCRQRVQTRSLDEGIMNGNEAW